jgi:hypothetical protein
MPQRRDDEEREAMLRAISEVFGPMVKEIQFSDPASGQVVAAYQLPQPAASEPSPVIQGYGDDVIVGGWYYVTHHHDGYGGSKHTDAHPCQVIGIRPHDNTYTVYPGSKITNGFFSVGYKGGSFWRTFKRIDETAVDPFLRNALLPIGTAATLRQLTKEQLLTAYQGTTELIAHVVLARLWEGRPPYVPLSEAMPLVLRWEAKTLKSGKQRQELTALGLKYPEVIGDGEHWSGGMRKIDQEGTLVNKRHYELRLFHPDGAGPFLAQVLEHCELNLPRS